MYADAARNLVNEGLGGAVRIVRFGGLPVHVTTSTSTLLSGPDFQFRRRFVPIYIRRFRDSTLRCVRIDIMSYTRNDFAQQMHRLVFDGFPGVVPMGCIQLTTVIWPVPTLGWVFGLPTIGQWWEFQRFVSYIVVQGELVQDDKKEQKKVLDHVHTDSSVRLYFEEHLDGGITGVDVRPSEFVSFGEFCTSIREMIHPCIREFIPDGEHHLLPIVVSSFITDYDRLIRLPVHSWGDVSSRSLYFFAHSSVSSQKIQLLFRRYIPVHGDLECIYVDIHSFRNWTGLIRRLVRLVFQGSGYDDGVWAQDVHIMWLTRNDGKMYDLPDDVARWRIFLESVAYIFAQPAWAIPPAHLTPHQLDAEAEEILEKRFGNHLPEKTDFSKKPHNDTGGHGQEKQVCAGYPQTRGAALLSNEKSLASNAKTEDLWTVREEESGEPVNKLMNSWTQEKGYPVVTVNIRDDKLELEQSETVDRTKLRGSSEAANSFQGKGNHQKWIKNNVEQAGFYRVKYDDELAARLRYAIDANQPSTIDRFGVLDDSYAPSVACKQSLSSLLSLMNTYKKE